MGISKKKKKEGFRAVSFSIPKKDMELLEQRADGFCLGLSPTARLLLIAELRKLKN